MKSLSRVQLFATLWTVTSQAPPSMGFSRQEYWHGLPLPSPGDLPDPGIEPGYPALQADALISEPPGTCIYSLSSSFPNYVITSHWAEFLVLSRRSRWLSILNIAVVAVCTWPSSQSALLMPLSSICFAPRSLPIMAALCCPHPFLLSRTSLPLSVAS